MRQRRPFTPEFKLEAVRLVTEQGYSVPAACRVLEMGETALRHPWKAEPMEESRKSDVAAESSARAALG